jgi:hypothetical protein
MRRSSPVRKPGAATGVLLAMLAITINGLNLAGGRQLHNVADELSVLGQPNEPGAFGF